MVALSVSDVVRFTPARYDGQENAPVYLIKPLSILERAKWRRSVAAEGCRFHGQSAVLASIRQGIEHIVAADERPQLLDLVDRIEAGTTTAEDDDLRAALEETMRLYWPPVTSMLADNQHWEQVSAIKAAQFALTGFENVSASFTRSSGLVTESCLAQLGDSDVYDIGWKAVSLMSVSKDAEKNSASPSPSPESQTPSTVTDSGAAG